MIIEYERSNEMVYQRRDTIGKLTQLHLCCQCKRNIECERLDRFHDLCDELNTVAVIVSCPKYR